jgi:exodeoxyribonuclease VII small subunit
LERLEVIVARLETGDAPLEEGLALFEEGVALSRRCHSLLSRVEDRVRRLVKEEDGTVTLELFPTPGGEGE